MDVFRSRVDTGSAGFRKNREDMLTLVAEVEVQLALARAGGGERSVARHRERGKLPIRERIALLLDPDTPFLEISPLAGWGSDFTVGGGFVSGIGVVSGVECVIFGNDPTVLGGAITAVSLKKMMRALEISRENRMPYVQFVESAGADLRRGTEDTEAAMRRQLTHFAESGRFFYEMTSCRSAIPTVSVVFGSSTAGGAYQPGMSDYNIVIRNQSKVFLGGPPLVKMATGEDSDDETLGGARCTRTMSGLGDYLAEDEPSALRLCREVISHLNWRKLGPGPTLPADEPLYDPEELLGLLPRPAPPVDIRDVIGRIVDGSRFEEFKPRYGRTLVCGWASHPRLPARHPRQQRRALPGLVAEGRALHPALQPDRRAAAVPAEHHRASWSGATSSTAGIIKKGSQMINAVTNSTVPHLTVIIGASYGAGTYAMCGRAFDNRFTFIWPTAKIAVMGPKQIAGVMSIVRRGGRARRGAARSTRRRTRRSCAAVERPGRARIAGARRHRARQRRRHHRPARHAHRARHLPVGRAQQRRRGRRRLRGVPAVSVARRHRCSSRTGARSRGA